LNLIIILILKLQDDTLKGQVSSVDISTKENMENLAKVAEGLLKKPVSRVNLETGNLEPSKHETNEEALIRCQIILIFAKCKKSLWLIIIAFILIMQVCKATLEREALSRNLITAEMRCEVATDINLSTAVQKISTDKFLTCMYEVDVTYFHGTLKRIPLQ
jgi:hypothetical protein